MKTELLNGYFIHQTNPNNFSLKRKYLGMRNGKAADCEKCYSHHPTFESAAEAFLKLYSADKTNESYKSVLEYVNALKKANAEVVERIHEIKMERFFMYVPQGNGKEEEHSIADLIPTGRESAIKRSTLTQLCVEHGLIDAKSKDKDRVMRELVKKARRDYVILNLSDGNGYYKVSKNDIQDLQRYIRQRESRIKSEFRDLPLAKALYEDYIHGRLQ